MKPLNRIIPRQHKGGHTGATAKKIMSTRHDALVLFQTAKVRLLDINNWYAISGHKGAEFTLTDKDGNGINKQPRVSDLIKIKLPAPKNEEGDGFDWVRIEAFEEKHDQMRDEECFGFRVRPVSNPKSTSDNSAHFYTSDATSTFLIYRETSTVYATERGRNEIPNTKASFLNVIRNIFIAIPAILGLAKPQWQNLVDGILKNK